MVPGVVEDIPEQGWVSNNQETSLIAMYFMPFLIYHHKRPLNAVVSSSTEGGGDLPIFVPYSVILELSKSNNFRPKGLKTLIDI